MPKTEYDLLDILEALGLSDADRAKQRSVESRLYTLRKGLVSKRKRRDGTYYDDPVTIEPQLIEDQDWFVKQGKAIRYTASGLRKILQIMQSEEASDVTKSARQESRAERRAQGAATSRSGGKK